MTDMLRELLTLDERKVLEKLDLAMTINPPEVRAALGLYIMAVHGEEFAEIIRKIGEQFGDALRAAMGGSKP